ncbi:hypothetical protein ACMFMG_010756 [Clarireedia jacksonii]
MHSPESSSQVTAGRPMIREDHHLSYTSFQRASITSIDVLMSRRPPVPPQTSSRLQSHSDHDPPPPYSQFNEVEKSEPSAQDIPAKRGGWSRLWLIVVPVFCALGLVLGFALSMTIGRRKSSNTPVQPINTDNNTNTITTNTAFPARNYSLPTFLTTITTNCTSNPEIWKCYPYSTYSAGNPSDSSATFQWLITSTSISNSPANLTISSTPNPFSIFFNNASLILKDEGLDTEHYFFQIQMQKQTRPDVQLGLENKAATCYFDGTVLEGELYTKIGVGAGAIDEGEETGTGGFVAWPGRVEVKQIAKAGTGLPRCVDTDGVSLGEFGVGGVGGEKVCECVYVNRE